jgi:hypothetical protein
LARKNARSDRVFLDFFVSFLIKQKRKGEKSTLSFTLNQQKEINKIIRELECIQIEVKYNSKYKAQTFNHCKAPISGKLVLSDFTKNAINAFHEKGKKE